MPPDWLVDPVALAYWDLHCSKIPQEQGEEFALCCQCWANLRATDQTATMRNANFSHWFRLAKVFRILPDKDEENKQPPATPLQGLNL